jgi:hypothetical protein
MLELEERQAGLEKDIGVLEEQLRGKREQHRRCY